MNAKEKTGAFKIEILISDILRWGVALSLGLMVLGTALVFLRADTYGAGGGNAEDLARLIALEHTIPHSLSWLGRGLLALDGQAVIVLGLLLLIATPVLRVVASVLVYLRERDWAYAGITGTVLALLVLCFLLGKVG